MESSLRIVAITNCPAGIAHTYMVAEALNRKPVLSAIPLKWKLKGQAALKTAYPAKRLPLPIMSFSLPGVA